MIVIVVVINSPLSSTMYSTSRSSPFPTWNLSNRSCQPSWPCEVTHPAISSFIVWLTRLPVPDKTRKIDALTQKNPSGVHKFHTKRRAAIPGDLPGPSVNISKDGKFAKSRVFARFPLLFLVIEPGNSHGMASVGTPCTVASSDRPYLVRMPEVNVLVV